MIDQSEYLGCYFFLHWINYFSSALFEKKNYTAVNQSELRNFFMYIISIGNRMGPNKIKD